MVWPFGRKEFLPGERWLMANPYQLTIDTEEILGRALRLRAAKEGVSPSEVANGILRKALAGEIEEASGVQPLAAVIQTVMKTTGRGGRGSDCAAQHPG